MKETKLRNQIDELKQNIDIEGLVSKKVQDYISNKKLKIDADDKDRNELREQKIKIFNEEKEELELLKGKTEDEQGEYTRLLNNL